jgi:hypothetical protein
VIYSGCRNLSKQGEKAIIEVGFGNRYDLGEAQFGGALRDRFRGRHGSLFAYSAPPATSRLNGRRQTKRATAQSHVTL